MRVVANVLKYVDIPPTHGNDLADSVAKHVLRTGSAVGQIDLSFCRQAILSGDISWAWLQLQPAQFSFVCAAVRCPHKLAHYAFLEARQFFFAYLRPPP